MSAAAIEIVLGLAVALSVGWILVLVGRQAFRADRRAQLREAAQQLATAHEGGDPSRPIEMASPAGIEPRFEREPCPSCGGSMHVEAHEIEAGHPDLLRRVTGRCGQCHGRRTTWYCVRSMDAD